MGPKTVKPCFLWTVTHFSHIWRVTFAPQSLQNRDPSATILIWHWILQAPSLDAASQDAQDPPGTPGYTYAWHDLPEGPGPRNTYIYIYIYIYIGVMDCPYGICCPWMRGGWDLDALEKFFRRRRRRRRPRLRVSLLSTNLVPT